MSTPWLLDAFCGAGGATKGYQRAGFRVLGVDIAPQPNYCGDDFYQGDAIQFISRYGHAFDTIHASPPCQAYSPLNAYNHQEYPDLIAQTRNALNSANDSWVIENVTTAPLISPIRLCGQMFDLLIYRERDFESTFALNAPLHSKHFALCTRNGYLPTFDRPFMSIHGGKHSIAWRKAAAHTMGVPWMVTIREICEAIPPAYTEYIGQQIQLALS